MNPPIIDVRAAFDHVATHATAIAIDRTGVALPKGGHFQGIQRLPGARQVLVITSLSDTQGYFVACDMAGDGLKGRARAPVTMATSPYRHAGGCQVVGEYLVAGLEDPDGKSLSEVQFWDFSKTPAQPNSAMTQFRSGPENVSTAGAVGLSTYGKGAVLVVATEDAATLDFYMSAGLPFSGSPLEKKFTWVADRADKTNWIDHNFGHYQNINLITQTDGQLFMVAFDRADSTDWMDLYSIDIQEGSAVITKLAKQHMYCTDGCSFDAGSGVFISSQTRFEVYAVNGSSGDHETGRTIHANHFSAN